MLTGLRKNELASLTVAQLQLDDVVPFLTLDAADEKNREGNEIPLRADLVADLRQWFADRLAQEEGEFRHFDRSGPFAIAYAPPENAQS